VKITDKTLVIIFLIIILSIIWIIVDYNPLYFYIIIISSVLWILRYISAKTVLPLEREQLGEESTETAAMPSRTPNPTVPPPDLRLAQLRAMKPAKFEEWIASKFNNAGYQARVVGGAGDDGIDIEVRSAGVIHFVVQAKRYSATNTINPEAVRGFRGAMTKYPEVTGYLVTTGSLTPQASAWVRNQPITVVDAKSIERWNPPPPELAD